MESQDYALGYLKAGWPPLELPAGEKSPPPEGRTGQDGRDMTEAEILLGSWSGNFGVRMPPDVIGLDVDSYHGGLDSFRELRDRLGPLPSTWISHNGRGDDSGIRFYRVQIGLAWVAGLPGIEIIQRGHRYAVVWPSRHPEGRDYAWWDQFHKMPAEDIPLVEDLPDLPWEWTQELSRSQAGAVTKAVGGAAAEAFFAEHTTADAPGYTQVIVAHFRERWQGRYSRHDTMQHCLNWALEHVRAGVMNGAVALDALAEAWVESVTPDARRMALTHPHRVTEFQAMTRHAIGKAQAKTEAELHKLHDDVAGIPMTSTTFTPPAPAAAKLIDEYQPSAPEASDNLPQPINWPDFANREAADRRWLVEGFWPWGRAMALWAKAKQGKSELALWCAGRLALGQHPWKDEPVEPIDVIYLDYEMTEDDLEERLADFGFDPFKLGHLHYFLLPALHGLDTAEGGKEVAALVQRYRAQAVIIDTLGRSLDGEEDKADTFHGFYSHTGIRLRQMGTAYLRTDHSGKNAALGPRGSSAKRDDVDVVWLQTQLNGGVLLDCRQSSRLSWVGPELKLDRIDTPAGVSYALPVSFVATVSGFPAGTAEKAADCIKAGVTPSDGRPTAIAKLRAANLIPGRLTVLSAALRYLKLPSPNQPGTVPGTGVASNPSGQPSGTPREQFEPPDLFEPSDQGEQDGNR